MGWVRLEVWTTRGPAWVEIKVKRDVVEWWLGRRSLAMMDREELGRWLVDPVGEFCCDEVRISLTEWGPALAIQDRELTLVNPLAFGDLCEKALQPT